MELLNDLELIEPTEQLSKIRKLYEDSLKNINLIATTRLFIKQSRNAKRLEFLTKINRDLFNIQVGIHKNIEEFTHIALSKYNKD